MGEENVVGRRFVGDEDRGEGSDLGDGGEGVGVRVAEGVGGDYEGPARTRRHGGGGEGEDDGGNENDGDRDTGHEGRKFEIGRENGKRYWCDGEERIEEWEKIRNNRKTKDEGGMV